ncbi:hypothetical protein BHM03_00036339 [Ensete ventricosum]|nr:hypothetical protein BHM03_00036339 [Ensete ventricosum]
MLHFQSSVLHSQPKSTVGTPAYIAPEVLRKKEYDGKVYFSYIAFHVITFFSSSILNKDEVYIAFKWSGFLSLSCTEHTDTWYTKVPSCAKSTGPLLDWYVSSVLSGKVFFTGKACTARYVPVWQLTGTRADRYRAVPLKSTVDG